MTGGVLGVLLFCPFWREGKVGSDVPKTDMERLTPVATEERRRAVPWARRIVVGFGGAILFAFILFGARQRLEIRACGGCGEMNRGEAFK